MLAAKTNIQVFAILENVKTKCIQKKRNCTWKYLDNFQFEFLSLTPPHNTINVFSSWLFCCLTESREKESDKLFFTGKRNPEECFWLKWKPVVSLSTTAVERPFCRKLTSLTEIREEIIPIFGGKWSRVCHDQMSQRQSGEHPNLEYSCFWNRTMA